MSRNMMLVEAAKRKLDKRGERTGLAKFANNLRGPEQYLTGNTINTKKKRAY